MNVRFLNIIALVCGFAVVIELVALNCHNAFFWDTVQLASTHANYYFQNGFSALLLPDDFDSGHIPAFGMYLAAAWKLFGRTLETSHFAMLPFAIGIVWQIFRLCRKFISEQYIGVALLLVLADPALLAQITLVSPDVALVFFFFFTLNAVLENKKWPIALGVFLLFLTSMRGMMVSVCLLCLDLFCNVFKDRTNLLWKLSKRSLLYLPAFIIFVAFNVYHYTEKGWIGYHKDSPWANCFEPVGTVKGLLFNIALYGWRLLDYGRIAIWIVLFVLLIRYRRKIIQSPQIVMLGSFTICMMALLPLNMLWAKNLLAPRYLLPIYLIFSFFTATVLFSGFVSRKLRIRLSVFWILLILSGNFWIYPPKISQGWDATLAHLPYYELRKEAIRYLDSSKISFKDVTTFFPNTATLDAIDLNGDERNFDNFDGKSKYVFYSNAFNVLDSDFEKIDKNYILEKRFENHRIFICLYRRK